MLSMRVCILSLIVMIIDIVCCIGYWCILCICGSMKASGGVAVPRAFLGTNKVSMCLLSMRSATMKRVIVCLTNFHPLDQKSGEHTSVGMENSLELIA